MWGFWHRFEKISCTSWIWLLRLSDLKYSVSVFRLFVIWKVFFPVTLMIFFLPQCKKILGSKQPTSCGLPVWTLYVLSWYFGLLQQSKNIHWVRLTDNLKFSIDANESMNDRLSLCVSFVIDWRPVQGVPCPFTLQQLRKDPDPKLDKLEENGW